MIAEAGGLEPLVDLASNRSRGVRIEALAALANLAVDGTCCSLAATGVSAPRRRVQSP